MSSVFRLALTALCVIFTGSSSARAEVAVSWSSLGITKTIDRWNNTSIGAFKKVTSREKDPTTGKVSEWQGVLLSSAIEGALKKLPAEELKARVDLIVLHAPGGRQAAFPRMLATRWPLMLATRRDGKALPEPTVVLPWTSRAQILSESLPLEQYFLSQVSGIELANYQERYKTVFLKRRTDPAAMRGEKIYVQNCMGCHAMTDHPSFTDAHQAKARKLATSDHPPIKGVKKLVDRDRRALTSYIEAYQVENPAGEDGAKASASAVAPGTVAAH